MKSILTKNKIFKKGVDFCTYNSCYALLSKKEGELIPFVLLYISFDEFVENTVHRFSVAFARSAKQLLRAFGDTSQQAIIRFFVVIDSSFQL